MSELFESMSVIELRQKAKEMGVKLGAGINKQGIVAKLTEAAAEQSRGNAVQEEMEAVSVPETVSRPIRSAAIITDDDEADEEDVPVLTPNPVLQSTPRSAARTAPVPTGAAAPSGSSLSTISAKAPAFTMEGSRAWHNPRAYQGAGAYQRPQPAQGWNARAAQPSPADQRGYGGRPANPMHADTRAPQARPIQQPAYVNRFGPEQTESEPRQPEYRAYSAPQQQDYAAPREGIPAQGGYGYSQPAYPRRESGMGIADILAAGDCGDGEGVLELHPEGYGFLRTNHYLPGKKSIIRFFSSKRA